MRDKFINSQETLLIWGVNDTHSSVNYNASLHDVVNVLDYAEDFVGRFFRVDENWRFEDVTEDVAEAFLSKWGMNPIEMVPESEGPWLSNSQALVDYIENWENERSDAEEHGTLDSFTQGI